MASQPINSRPRYPIYIVSKGRHYNPVTAKYLTESGIHFYIVVEPQEYELYLQKIPNQQILVLPFSNLGLGSYPARNFCWEHSTRNQFKRHWVLDDNIRGFLKWRNGKKYYSPENNIKAIQFVEKYSIENDIDISGFEYRYFCAKPPKRPFKQNCHVYSAMLIKNDLPYRWRLKYNEDVDLCLQVLHNGGTTASCMYYLSDKESTTHKMKGGNQTELYKGNDPAKKLLKAKMLEKVWPQYAKTVIRFNRYHHLVDWKVFSKNSRIIKSKDNLN